MSISAQSEARGLESLPRSKYFNILKQKNRLTLGLNAAKNTDCMKRSVK